MKNKLADFNLFYALFFPIVQYATLCHYRRIVVKGKENLPEGERYILAPCHQNALMDPLIVLRAEYKPIAFLARADIFKKPLIRKLLTWLRISPVYRIRDGRDQLANNQAVFQNAREVLEAGMPLCLMAEGTHNDKHQLLPLVKGMFRIAGITQQELGDNPLYIVPVGLDYDAYEQPYHSVAIDFGKPIDVRPFMEEFNTNEPVALNQMRDAVAAAIKAQIHQVEAVEHYADEYAYCHLKTQATLKELKLKNNVWGRFMARKHISQTMTLMDDTEREKCYRQGAEFAALCERKRIPLWYASRTRGKAEWIAKSLLMMVTLGLAVFLCWDMLPLWLLCNPIVYLPTHLIVRAKIEDPQFRSSINYGVRFGLMLVYFLLLFIIGWCTHTFFWALGMVLLGCLSAWLTPKIFILLRDAWYGCRLYLSASHKA